jgi:hypothetical protein
MLPDTRHWRTEIARGQAQPRKLKVWPNYSLPYALKTVVYEEILGPGRRTPPPIPLGSEPFSPSRVLLHRKQ